jgi:hypothetical protein
MRYAAEIARILDRAQDPTAKVITWGMRVHGKDKISKLYQTLYRRQLTNDDQIAAEIFSCSAQDQAFTTAKSRLRRRLLNSLTLLNLRRAGLSDQAQLIYSCFRGLFLVQTMLHLGGRRTGIRLAKSVLRKAKRAELTSISGDLTLLLMRDASLRGDENEFVRLTTELNNVRDRQRAEELAMLRFSSLDLLLKRGKGHSQEIRDLSSMYAAELRSATPDLASYNFTTYSLRVDYIHYLVSGRTEDLVELCDRAIRHFSDSRQSSSKTQVAEFAHRKLEACTVLKHFTAGTEAFYLAKSNLKESSNNWFLLHLQFTKLLLSVIKLEKAREVVSMIMENERYNSIHPLMQEQWKVLELHLDYAQARQIPHSSGTNRLSAETRLQKLLSIAPTLSQDKQGHKVSLLILHILYLLEIGDFNGIIDRMEALRLYRARYLKASQFPKTATFFRLLTIMENNSFSYKLVKEKGEKDYQKLLESNENQEEINEGLQILPYDWLWQKILERLKEYEEANAKKVVY